MRDHTKHIQLSREEGVANMLKALKVTGFYDRASAAVERVALGESFGRVLAQDVYAKTDIPNALTCCKDSVALHWRDFENLAEGEIPDTSNWVRGVDWQFANTGIAMPQGFDTAIVVESVEVADDEQSIVIMKAPSEQYAGTRHAGSTMKRGDLAVEAGCVIDADVAASIASAGYSSILVVRKPRVSFLPTGNELVPPNLPYSEQAAHFYAGYGHVFESNSILTRGKVEQWGGIYAPFDIVPDEYDVIKDTILQAARTSDIVVLNAGSSKGSDDWSVEVLDEIGTMIFHQVAHGPSHHCFAAMVEGTPVVGISGPPGGASFALGFYLQPVMNAWLGLETAPKLIPVRLTGSFGENKFAAMFAKKKQAGEDRPNEASEPGMKFWSVRFLRLSVDADGTICAAPIERSEAGKGPSAIYMLPSGPDDIYPQDGAIIYVEPR